MDGPRVRERPFAVDPESAKLAGVFEQAAHYIAYGIDAALEYGLPNGEAGELILKVWGAATGRDIAADIEAARVERDRQEAQENADALQYMAEHPEEFKKQPPRRMNDLDDDIPF
jgi:hypothetical protein